MLSTSNSNAHHASPTGQQRTTAILVTGAGGEMGHGLLSALNAARSSNSSVGDDAHPAIIAVDIRELAPVTKIAVVRCCPVGEA